jgi:hypothetical protein
MAPSYTAGSVERALDVHRHAGRIRSWHRDAAGYIVTLNRSSDLRLRSLREAYVFVAGLASAGHAPPVSS